MIYGYYNICNIWQYHIIDLKNIMDLKNFKLKTTYHEKIKPLRIQLYEIYTIKDIIDILNSFGFIPIDDILEIIIQEYIKILPFEEEIQNIKYLMNNHCFTQIEEYATQTLWFAINYAIKVKIMNDKLKERYFLKLSRRNIVGSHCNFENIEHLKINNNYSFDKPSNKSVNDNLLSLDLPCLKRKSYPISISQNYCPCVNRK